MHRKSTKYLNEVNRLVDNARGLMGTDPGKAIEQLDEALHLIAPAEDGLTAVLKYEKALALQQLKHYKEAIAGLDEAKLLYENSGDPKSAVRCDEIIGNIHLHLGNNEEALSKLLDVLLFWKQHNDIAETALTYNSLGELYKSLSEYNKAIEMHMQAHRLFESVNDRRELCITDFYIGNCYNWANELDAARNYLKKSLQEADELGDPVLKVKPMGSLAILYTKEKKFARALAYFNQCVDMLNITGDDFLKSDILKSLGKLYLELKQPAKAIATLQEALVLAEKLKLRFPTNVIHDYLSQTYDATGEYDKALTHYKTSVRLTNEIRNDDISLKTAGMQIRFDLDELRREKELAERKSELNDRFLSGISHELRTSLSGIEGMVSLLAETHPSPEQLEYINTIRLSANNLLVIISDLLDFSRISEGRIDFEKQEFKLREHLTALIQMLKMKTDEKNLKLVLRLDKNLPDKVTGDPMRLSQILFNLFNNAIRFTEKGSVMLQAQAIREENGKARLSFLVSDSGIGIAEKQLPFIFEKYANASMFDGQKDGTGIGLSMVKHLVERQGGTVQVTSRINEGTRVHVELEYAVPPSESRREASASESNVYPVDLSTTRVLLVEDNKVNQFLARQLLTKMGLIVTVAGHADAAIASLKNQTFDIILMDVQIPGMSGYELSRYIRQQLPAPVNRIPIIAITAYVSATEKEAALEAGMMDYIAKPYSPQELLSVIMKHVPDKRTDRAEPQLVIDLLQLMGGSKEDLVELIEVFVDQTPAMNADLHKQIQAKNWKKAYHAAHKLKSSLRILKSEKLNDLISRIEDNTESLKNLESTEMLFEEYLACCLEYISQLQVSLPLLRK